MEMTQKSFKGFLLGWEKLLFIQKWSTGRCLKGRLDIMLSWADPNLKLNTHIATHLLPTYQRDREQDEKKCEN